MSGAGHQPFEQPFETVVDPVDGTVWHVDAGFLASGWTCIWDRGCEGIGSRPAPELGAGCCSVGAELLDEDEALRVGALGASLDPDRFEHHRLAEAGGVFSDSNRTNTRVVDGACIFLNRPEFAGGSGCALHLAALGDECDPMDYKPAICWQGPLKVDQHEDGTKTLRTWGPADWNGDIAWCCTDPNPPTGLANAFIEPTPVARRLHNELRGIVGPEVAVEIRNRFDG